jgi:predicted ferric reductase
VDPHFFWYLARASGVVTFVLVTFSTALGLLISTRLGDRLFGRPWVFELHNFSSLLSLGFLGLHIGALLADTWTHFRVIDLLVPGTSAYRPVAVAMGVLAMYGAALGTASFYVKRQLGYRLWRLLHYTTFATFALALLHGIAAGTDTPAVWMRWLYALAGTLVASLVVYRLSNPRPTAPARDPARRPADAPAGGGSR